MSYLQDELARRQRMTDTLLSARYDPSSSRSSILSRQDPFYQRLGVSEVARQPFKKKLGRELERGLAERMRTTSQDRISKVYDLAIQRATQAGLSRDEAIAYGRQVANDELRRTQEAGLNFDARASAERKQDIQSGFADRGIALEGQFGGQGMDYESAMIRALFGLGGATGTAYALNKNYTQTEKNPLPATTSIRGSGQSLREQSMYTPRRY